MRFRTYLTMALVPAALVAQTPAATDYSALLKQESPAIDALLKDYRVAEALKKAESLLPPTPPAFAKATPTEAMQSSISFSGLTRVYLLAAKAAVQAGEWEKVLDLCVKAEATAKANYENTRETMTPIMASWTQAVEQADTFVKANGERIQALAAKPGRNAQEEEEFQAFIAKEQLFNTTKNQREKAEAAKWLNANKARHTELEAKAITPQDQDEINMLKVAQNNLVQGPKTLKALQGNIDATKTESELCAPKIASTQKNLADEAAEIEKGVAATKVKGKVVKETSGPKFEEKKATYFSNVLTSKSNYDSRPNKLDRMNFLARLRHNVAGTPLEAKVTAVMDRVIADKDPLEVEKKAGKGKGKKAK